MKKHAVFAGIFIVCLIYNANIFAIAHHDNIYGTECHEHHTVDDIVQRAKESGYPEDIILAGRNQWESDDYTQDDLDTMYHQVEKYDKKLEDLIKNMFPPSTEPSPELPQETASPINHRIDSDTFINMTLEEKQNYINSLSDSEREAFLAGLSPAERNSMIKQLPADQKMQLTQDYIDTANTMGLNISVDAITDDNISLTIRNDDGIIINKADVGVVIDETGISHTKPLLFTGLGILTAITGFGVLYWYSRHTEL